MSEESKVLCPSCRKEFVGYAAEFIKGIGECASCDHVRGDMASDQRDDEERTDNGQE